MATEKKPAVKPAVKKTSKTTKTAVVVKPLAELEKDLATKQQELADARRSHLAGDLVNPRVLTVTRKDIARLKTAINAAKAAEKKESN